MTCKDLRTAVLEWDVQCLRELLRSGADPNTRYEQGMTPLHYVASNCQSDIFTHYCVEAARVLLENGANPNAKNEWGMSPLHYAAYGGNSKLVKLLLDYGADPNATDRFKRTPLLMAVLNNFANADTVRLLLERGANPAIADVYGRTPIDYAMRLGRDDIVQILTSRTPQLETSTPGRRRRLFRRAKKAA